MDRVVASMLGLPKYTSLTVNVFSFGLQIHGSVEAPVLPNATGRVYANHGEYLKAVDTAEDFALVVEQIGERLRAEQKRARDEFNAAHLQPSEVECDEVA